MAAELDCVAPDANWLLPMSQAVKDKLDELPELGLADAGYRSEENLRAAAMAAKLRTDEGRAACRKRRWIAGPPNGWIKNVLGLRQFSLRGLHRVRAECKLVCMALNLRRMAVHSAG